MLNYKNFITSKDKEVYDPVTDTSAPMSYNDMEQAAQAEESRAKSNKVASMLMSIMQ